MSRLEKLLLSTNFLIYTFLTVFSYSYVDLNLTLSQNPQFLKFVAFMQQLGYYNRPQATAIYTIFVICAFSFFALNLWLFYKSKISTKYLLVSTIFNTIILIFAYPFLSYDIFNYMFDAKIIYKYHASPYTHKPLDFPQDTWLRFMHWVHRYSPYGPLWLAASLIPTIVGFGKFVLTLLTFKVFISSFHLINSLLIYKTLERINPKLKNFGTAMYALNPLFLIEGIANAHNDIVLATFILLPIYFAQASEKIYAVISTIAGTLLKYIAILNLPFLFWFFIKKRKVEELAVLNLFTMAMFTYIFSSFRVTVPFVSSGSTQVQFQPWYLFWTLPLISLIPKKELIMLFFAISIGATLRYLPYLYYGDWSQPGTINFMTMALTAPAIFAIFAMLTLQLFKSK